MIMLLDTSAPSCVLTFIDQNGETDHVWQADRSLARGIHAWIEECLRIDGFTWSDVRGIGVFRGPGSFTGLRIGSTVMNTYASALAIPIVGTIGSSWKQDAVTSLASGANDSIVIPLYGGDAHITAPRK